MVVTIPLVALVLVMFTYSGWNAAAYVAGELRDPSRTVVRSLLGGTALVIALYLGLNLLYVRTLGVGGIAAAEATGDRMVEVLWGTSGTRLFTPLILLVLASSVSAMVLTGPRVYYAMATDRCLPPVFARLPGSGVPAFGITATPSLESAQASDTCAHVVAFEHVVDAGEVVSGSAQLELGLVPPLVQPGDPGGFEALLTYTGFAVVLFAALGVASLLVLRRRAPDAHRPFRVPGYPWAPGLFIAASVAMVVQSVLRAPGPSLAGLGLVALGVPVYLWVRRREQRLV